MSRRFNLFGSVVVLILVVACTSTVGIPPDGQLSRAEKESIALELVESVSGTYDCDVSFDSFVDGLDPDAGGFSVFVRLSGKKCDDALQGLRDRGEAVGLVFGERVVVDPQASESLLHNQDLIHEINPQPDE